MPYEWVPCAKPLGKQSKELHLWPYRSLPRRGFVFFIGLSAMIMLIPVLGLVGSAHIWGILVFCLIALGLIWWALQYNHKQGEVFERLSFTSTHICLDHYPPNKPPKHWQANIYWAGVHIYKTGGPIPDYITLKGGGREVEIGVFLSPDERKKLFQDLNTYLSTVKSAAM